MLADGVIVLNAHVSFRLILHTLKSLVIRLCLVTPKISLAECIKLAGATSADSA